MKKLFNQYRIVIYVFIAILSVSQIAIAQEDLEGFDDVDAIKTEKVLVTASRVEKELLDLPMSVTVITQEEIQSSPATSIGELLEDVPGLTIAGAPGLKRISIRGENANRVLILIDGQKIVENKSMSGVPVLIDPSSVERIEVIKGPASVLYGSEAMGGVVNIITKKGGDKPIEGDVGVTYTGTSSGFAEYLSLYGAAGGFNYRLSGSFTEQGNYRIPDGLVPNSKFSQSDIFAFLSYDIKDNMTIGAGYQYFNADIMTGSAEEGYEKFYVDMPKWYREKGYVFFEAKDVATFLPRIRFDTFYQVNHKKMINHVEIVGMPMIIDNNADNINKQLGASIQLDWNILDNTYLITGIDVNYDMLDATTTSLQKGVSPPFIGKDLNQIAYHDGYSLSNAIYVQGESLLPADFSLSYGVRYTYIKSKLYQANGRVWGTDVVMSGRPPTFKPTPVDRPTTIDETGATGTAEYNQPVFGAGIVWQGVEDLAIRFNFAQGYRVPTLLEQYVPSSMGGGTILPNPDLSPEFSNNFELGSRYSIEGFAIDIVYFISLAEDYIASRLIDPVTDTYRPENIDSAYTQGVELSTQYEFDFGLTPYVSVRWLERKYTSADGSSTWLTGNPTILARAGVDYHYKISETTSFFADLYGRFASSSKDISAGKVISGDAWETLNVALGFNFGKKQKYSLMAEIHNIFDTEYLLTADNDTPEPGLYATVKFVIKF